MDKGGGAGGGSHSREKAPPFRVFVGRAQQQGANVSARGRKQALFDAGNTCPRRRPVDAHFEWVLGRWGSAWLVGPDAKGVATSPMPTGRDLSRSRGALVTRDRHRLRVGRLGGESTPRNAASEGTPCLDPVDVWGGRGRARGPCVEGLLVDDPRGVRAPRVVVTNGARSRGGGGDRRGRAAHPPGATACSSDGRPIRAGVTAAARPSFLRSAATAIGGRGGGGRCCAPPPSCPLPLRDAAQREGEERGGGGEEGRCATGGPRRASCGQAQLARRTSPNRLPPTT